MTQHPTKKELAELVEHFNQQREWINNYFPQIYKTALRLEPMREELEKARDCNKEAVKQIGELARKLGQVQGKLAASEMVGVVDGWKERAEAAEAERDALRERVKELREALKPFAPEKDLDYADEKGVLLKIITSINSEHIIPGLRWGDFRRACAALAKDDK